RGDVQRLVSAGALDAPRERQARTGASREMNLETVERSRTARADRAPVPPGGIGVAVVLADWAALRDVPLAVRVRGQVGCVDSHVPGDAGKLGLQGGGDPVQAVREHGGVLAELDGEAVGGK